MAKPWIHASSSVRKFGGQPNDYLPIHNLLDSSKGVIADSRHRALTHTAWFLWILERIFGVVIRNSDGREVSVREIGEQHILEDFGGRFIPSAQDYLEGMEFKEWMLQGKGEPPSSFKFKKPKLGGKHVKKESTEVSSTIEPIHEVGCGSEGRIEESRD